MVSAESGDSGCRRHVILELLLCFFLLPFRPNRLFAFIGPIMSRQSRAAHVGCDLILFVWAVGRAQLTELSAFSGCKLSSGTSALYHPPPQFPTFLSHPSAHELWTRHRRPRPCLGFASSLRANITRWPVLKELTLLLIVPPWRSFDSPQARLANFAPTQLQLHAEKVALLVEKPALELLLGEF